MSIDLLGRLHPEDVHPARLAGPHAWARWGLGPPVPIDEPLRFVVAAHTSEDTIERILGAMQLRLARVPWPPQPALRLTRVGQRLDVISRVAQSSIRVEAERATTSVIRRPAETVDLGGWGILDEPAALADRLLADRSGDDAALIEDLARWGALKGDQIVRDRLMSPSVPMVLGELHRISPAAHAELRKVLETRPQATESSLTPALAEGLRYLQDGARSVRRGRPVPPAAVVR